MTDPKTPPAHPGTAVRLVQSDELLSTQEAADALGWSTSKFSRAVRDGVVIPLRRSPDLYHADDIRALGGKP